MMTPQQRQMMKENAALEAACYEQAKVELGNLKRDVLTYIRKVAARAQEIKGEKNGKG